MRVQTVDCGGEESLWRRRLLGIRVLRQGAQQIGTTYDWKRDLKPHGFGLAAQILEFPDGIPGDAGLILVWGT